MLPKDGFAKYALSPLLSRRATQKGNRLNLNILLQYLAPQKTLTRLTYALARWTFGPWKRWAIQHVIRKFNVDLSLAAEPNPDAYPHFNAFFTRTLRPDARQADPDCNALLCPADGRISQVGRIDTGRIFQAKGHDYSVDELLGGDAQAADPYRNGHFVTIYLSPSDYHRVHMPLGGRLVRTVHVPGKLFSVSPATVDAVPRLFARNERLVCHFESGHGPFVVVMVGAMLVSSVTTVWGGLTIPPYARTIQQRDYDDDTIEIDRFAEMARFNMGSTVIVLFPDGMAELDALGPQQKVQYGERLGQLTAAHRSAEQA